MGMRWLDTHIHVSDRNGDGTPRDGLLDHLLRVLDDSGADLHLVISPDGHWNRLVRDDPDGAHRANAFIRGLVAAAPGRLYGSCIVNPNYPRAALHTMAVCFEEWGFVQLGEMLQYMFDFDMDHPDTEGLVHKAVDYGVPVQVHVSTSNARSGASSFGREQLLDLLALSDRVPEAKIVLAHAVGTAKGDPPVVDEYLDMIEERRGGWPERFWLEIRDVDSPGVRSVLARVPSDRLLCGTDWTTRVGPPFLPYGTLFGTGAADENPYEPSVPEMARLLRAAGATAEVVRKIGFGNAASLLGIADA